MDPKDQNVSLEFGMEKGIEGSKVMSQETVLAREEKYMPKKNTPLPWHERHISFDKRKGLKVWPNGARMAFLTYCALEQRDWNGPRIINFYMGKTPISRSLPKTPLDVRTQAKYGWEIGVLRIRDILQEEGIKFTFLVTGSYAEDYPEITKQLAELGYEINAHTYSYSITTPELTREEQKEDIRKTMQILQQVTGKKPVGWLSQGASCDENTIALMAEEGFLYNADLQDDELPYFIDISGKTFVEIPYRMLGNLNDYALINPQQMSLSDVLENLKYSFDACYREAAKRPLHFNFGTHPYVIGRADNAWVFQEFIRYVKSYPDVWITTYQDMAEWWMKQFNNGYPV